MGRKLQGAIDGGGIVMLPGIREQQDAYASLQVESLFEGERVIESVKALAPAIGIGPEVDVRGPQGQHNDDQEEQKRSSLHGDCFLSVL